MDRSLETRLEEVMRQGYHVRFARFGRKVSCQIEGTGLFVIGNGYSPLLALLNALRNKQSGIESKGDTVQ